MSHINDDMFFFKWKFAGQQGEIKITAFNKEVDKFYSLVEQGKVSRSHSPISILNWGDKSFF